MKSYEMLWNERKSFLFSSMAAGGVIAIFLGVLATAIMIYENKMMDGFVGNVFEIIGSTLLLFIMFSACIAVGRLVFGKSSVGGNFATNMVHGFWVTVVNTITGGWLGLMLGLFLCFVFFWLFMAVTIGYSIYLPVSSIYLYVKYKKEIA